MEQLLFHLWGDFIVQTDTWALNKKKKGFYGFKCCLYHCLTYSLPFLLIGSVLAWVVIFSTHFLIDRTRLIDYALAIKNNVTKWNPELWYNEYDVSNFGFGLDRPFAISIWLYIIADNTIHVTCNWLALTYL